MINPPCWILDDRDLMLAKELSCILHSEIDEVGDIHEQRTNEKK